MADVEPFYVLVDNSIAVDTTLVGHVRQREQRLQVVAHLTVLHFTTIVVVILWCDDILVDDHPLVVFLYIYIAELAHFAQLRFAPPLLNAQMLVELRLRHTELIHLSLCRHSQPTIAGSTCQQASPEIGEGLDDA